MNENIVMLPDRDLAGESLAVVFLHHFGGSSATWEEVINRLRRTEPGIRCVAPDLHGFGGSGNRQSSDRTSNTESFKYHVDDYADEVAALLIADGIKRYVLVGHSMGGKIALALAARRPAGLEAVLLVAPSPPSPEPMSDDDREQLMQARGDAALAAKIVSSITFRPLSKAIQQRTVADMLRSSAVAWRAWLEGGAREDISSRMSQIDAPMVVLAAGHDRVMTASLLRQEIIHRVAGSRLIVVPDSAHLVPLDAPAAIVRLLRDVIASLVVMQDQPIAVAETEYPPGTVRELLATDAVSEPTRQVLCDRLNTSVAAVGEFFDSTALKTLRAVCARLVPQRADGDIIDIARAIDHRLAGGRGNGWRYDVLPNDGETYRAGLKAIDDTAWAAFSMRFCDISDTERDQLLLALQHNKVAGGCWTALPPGRFFEELLAEASEIYFSHPLAQERIGYVGMADNHGWTQVGLNMLAAREPRPSGVSHG